MSQSILRAGFKKVDITPRYPVRLAGYLNERISEGVLDPLFLRLATLSDGRENLLFIQMDNCAMRTEEAEEIRAAIARASQFRKDEIMLFASHVHTGPDLVGFFGLPRDERYLEDLKKIIVEEASGLKAQTAVSISFARASYEGLVFNRRWWMKDGSVVTNPPKRSPSRLNPEGGVDREAISVLFMDERERPAALFVNISNHTDTIGGTKISADWPGFMERSLNEWLGEDIPVFLLLAPQGNVNHFDFEDDQPQSSYAEAARLGQAYARVVADSLSRLQPIRIEGRARNGGMIQAKEIRLSIPSREVSPAEIERAMEILAQNGEQAPEKERSLTAEDLARGDPVVERIFARELIRFVETRPEHFLVPLQVFKLGSLAFAAIPGEPFVEIGLSLKNFPGFSLVVPVALANGYFGYIPREENFGRGGYETRTGPHSCLSRDAATRILNAFRSLLED